jgi:NADH-quinone oxidoreductase subunit N
LLTLLSILGLLLLVSSNDLITAYLAIEMQSLSFYVLATFKRESAFSTESGLKYFILGAFSSGLILFGSSYIYGLTGSLNFTDLSILLDGFTFESKLDSFSTLDGLKIFILFIVTGLLFKLAAAPFHMWSPDVYEGAPTSSTAIFAIVPKIAIFVLLTRIFHGSFYSLIDSWQQMIIFSAIISVVIGSFVALKQRKLKRLIAYSAISHVGYLLIAFSTGTFEGSQALFFYMVIYMITGLATWSIVLSIDSIYGSTKNLSDITALVQINKTMAITFSLILFSLAGIPPLAGFYAKMYVFLVAMSSSFYLPAIVAVLSSVISTFYYIRIIKVIYFEKPEGFLFYFPVSQVTSLILGTSFFLIVLLFIEPHLITYYTANMINILGH